MRHEQLKVRDSFDVRDAAALWPRAGEGSASSALAEVEAAIARPTPAVPDVPAAVGAMIVAAYAGLIAVFALTMARGLEASFMIVVSGLFVAIYLAVPAIFLRVENDRSRRPDLACFLELGLDTWTGRMSGRSALVQIFIVPVSLGFGLLAIGLAGLWIL
jgi:hypothetical protein